jgi:hypothetical protein
MLRVRLCIGVGVGVLRFFFQLDGLLFFGAGVFILFL